MYTVSGNEYPRIAYYSSEVDIFDSRFTDEQTARSLLSDFICVYKLASPIEHTFTAQQIRTLLGQNNIWADIGDVSLTYPADTKGYIAKALSASQRLMELIITANREDSMKATKAYTAGNLLIVNNTLYKATTSIANGAMLTVGTNVTETNIGAELALLA